MPGLQKDECFIANSSLQAPLCPTGSNAVDPGGESCQSGEGHVEGACSFRIQAHIATPWISKGRASINDGGGGGGYRTPDPRLMSPLLYRLSYTATLEKLTG